jgi:hypothetical protein
MTNVCVSSPIIAFHGEDIAGGESTSASRPDQLLRREKMERAAAKASATVAARRAHQELAQLLYEARKGLEAAYGGTGTEAND